MAASAALRPSLLHRLHLPSLSLSRFPLPTTKASGSEGKGETEMVLRRAAAECPKKVSALVDLVNLPTALREFAGGRSQLSHLSFFLRVWSHIKNNNLQDKSVVWWSIQDHISALGDSSKSESSPGASGSKQSGKTANEKDSPKVDPRGVFHGHDSTVEDVQFCPSSAQEFCSVGDDACLILWDARTGTSPAVKVEKAHGGDVHCVDWNLHDVNYILTGYDDMKAFLVLHNLL